MHNGGPLFVLAASNGSRKQSRWEPQANGSRKQSPRGVRSLDVAQGCVVTPDADSSVCADDMGPRMWLEFQNEARLHTRNYTDARLSCVFVTF